VITLMAIAALGQSCIAQQVAYQPVQYAQTYAQPYNQSYVERTIFVAVEAQDAPAYYAGIVGQAQRAAERQQQTQQVQSSTDQKIDRLAALVEQLQRRIDASEPPPPDKPRAPSPAVPAVAPVSSEAVPPPPTISQASQRTGQHVGLAVLTKSCAGCHSGAASKGGGVGLFAADGSWSVRDKDDLERVEAAIISGRMPKRSSNLTLREYATVRDFLIEQANGLAFNTTNQRKKPL
jgi:mono/diheme cytochrome c family protein